MTLAALQTRNEWLGQIKSATSPTLIQKYDSGFIRIRRALQDYPEVQFEVQEFQGGVMAIFTQKQSGSPDEGANVGVNVGVNSLLTYIQAKPGQRASEMVGTFAVTQRTIERWLKQLKAKGLIEFTGAPKTGGYHRKNTLNQPLAHVYQA